MRGPENENGTSVKYYRAGFGVLMISQTVMFLTLIAVRFLIAGAKIGPYNELIGVIITAVMVISALVGRQARSSAKAGNAAGIQSRLNTAFWLGVLGLLLVLLEWVVTRNTGVSVVAPSLEVFWVATGVWVIYLLVGLFVLYAARSRGVLVGYDREHHWDLEASTLFWSFVVLMWIAVWVAFYLI